MEATKQNIIEQMTKAAEITAHHIVSHQPLERLLKGFAIAMVAMQELVDKEPRVIERRAALDNVYEDFPGLRECIVAVARSVAVGTENVD